MCVLGRQGGRESPPGPVGVATQKGPVGGGLRDNVNRYSLPYLRVACIQRAFRPVRRRPQPKTAGPHPGHRQYDSMGLDALPCLSLFSPQGDRPLSSLPRGRGSPAYLSSPRKQKKGDANHKVNRSMVPRGERMVPRGTW